MPITKSSKKKLMSIADCTRAYFVRATKAGKLICTALGRLLFNIGGPQLTGRLVIAGGALNFDEDRYFTDIQTSEYFSAGKPVAVALRVQLPANGSLPVLLLPGVEFYKKINDQFLLLYGGGPLALRVVHTDQLPAAAAAG